MAADASSASEPVRDAMTNFGPDGAPTYFSRERSRQAILGAIVGAALGDAVGLQTDGRDAETVRERFSGGVSYPYSERVRGFPPLGWSDVTEQAILVMQTLTAYFASETDSPTLDLGRRLARWQKTGESALDSARAPVSSAHRPGAPLRPAEITHDGAKPPRRIPADTTTRAIAQKDFLDDPIGAARSVTGPKADNGALYRSIACAFTSSPAEWAITFAEVTHADERCGASAVMLAGLVHNLSRAASEPSGSAAQLAREASEPVSAGRAVISPDSPGRRHEFMRRLTESSSLKQLGLGQRDDQAYTLLTLACAMWAFRQLVRTPPAKRDSALFQTTITELASQGGSACANCSVAGCVLGAVLGYDALPLDWVEDLPLCAELVQEVDRFIYVAETSGVWVLPPGAS